MFNHLTYNGRRPLRRLAVVPILIILLGLLLSACDSPTTSQGTPTTQVSPTSSVPNFSTAAPPLRVPAFGTSGQIAPTVKVLASVDPTLIVQFPLVPASVKTLFPNASGLVTVFQNPVTNNFDTVTVNVQNMPPNVKFTVFFTELSAKPFGHAEYVGDLITRQDGSGESVFHLITFVAFAADNRNPGTSTDQSGSASGIQLEHVGMWFDNITNAKAVLQNPSLAATPFDGGRGRLHAGPQALTDGQTLPVI
jgi:hypothetical protein